MSLSVATAFVALATTTTAVLATAVTSTSVSSSSEKVKKAQKVDFHNLKDLLTMNIKCYIVETISNIEDRLLACTNKKYYLHNLHSDSLKELQPLIKLSDNEILSYLIKGGNQNENRKWTVTGEEWRKLPNNTTLKLGDNSKQGWYCNVESVLGLSMKMQRALVCKQKATDFPITIPLSHLEDYIAKS